MFRRITRAISEYLVEKTDWQAHLPALVHDDRLISCDLAKAIGAKIWVGAPQLGLVAQYDWDMDLITMPSSREHITRTHTYDTALLHELAHWTGHKTRLNRINFISYSEEEIVAELACAYLCCLLKVPHSAKLHAYYISFHLQFFAQIQEAMPKAIEAVEYIGSRIDACQYPELGTLIESDGHSRARIASGRAPDKAGASVF